VQILDLPELHLPVPRFIPKGRARPLAPAQLEGLLIDFHVLPLEHDNPPPAQLIDGPQKRSLGIPGIGADAVKEAGAVNAAQPAQQPQGRRALIFAGVDRLNIQHDMDLGTAEVGEDVGDAGDDSQDQTQNQGQPRHVRLGAALPHAPQPPLEFEDLRGVLEKLGEPVHSAWMGSPRQRSSALICESSSTPSINRT